jgi:trimeric autotransporter adhesin
LISTSELIGAASAVITVTGTGFVPTTVINVNGAARTTTFTSSTQISVAMTGADVAASGSLSLTAVNPTPGGGTSAALSLPVNNPAAGTIHLNPSMLTAGSTAATTVTVTGGLFVPASVVQVNGSARVTTFVNTTTLMFVATVADQVTTGTLAVTVTNPSPGGGTSSVANLIVAPPAGTPVVTSVTSGGAPLNTASNIVVVGTGFNENSVVQLDGVALITSVANTRSLSATIPASALSLPVNHTITVNTPAPDGGTSSSFPFTAYIGIPNNAMAKNPVNGLLYISVPSSAGSPYGNSVVSVDPATGALGNPIYVGSEPDKLAISSDGTTLWVALDGSASIREVNLTAGTPGMQFSLGQNTGIYAFPPIVHAIAVLPGSPNSIVVSSPLNESTYTDFLAIYDSGVARLNTVQISTLGIVPPAIFVSPTKQEVYATSADSGYQVLAYDAAGLTNLAGNTGTSNFSAPYGTAVQIDNGRAYLDTGIVLDAESGTLLGTFYSSENVVATGPMVSDSAFWQELHPRDLQFEPVRSRHDSGLL